MDDEQEWVEIDSRLRAQLQPADHDPACRRVVTQALAAERRTSRHRFRVPLITAGVVALALLVVVAAFEWRRRAAASISHALTITSVGSVLVVESDDGRRWIVGPSLPRRSGSYVVVVAE